MPSSRRTVIVLAAVGFTLGTGASLQAQFTPEEIIRRADCEIFLRTGDIIGSEPVGEGVTAPWKLTLRLGKTEHRAVWKDIDTDEDGIPDRWRYEIAAYRLDRLLGLNMIPPVEEREFQGRRGALSYWADVACSLLQVQESDGAITIPPEAAGRVDDAKYITRLWDSLIANDDRTQQNILYCDDWRTILIDHSRAFRADGPYRRRLIYGANGIKTMDDGAGGRRPVLFRRLPRALLERIRALTAEAVREAVGPYLETREIEALLARRELILAEVEAMIARDGEGKVLY